LILIVMLQAVRVFTVTPIGWPRTGFGIGHPPRLGTKHAQERRGVGCARANFGVVRLPEHAATFGPETVQGLQYILKIHVEGLLQRWGAVAASTCNGLSINSLHDTNALRVMSKRPMKFSTGLRNLQNGINFRQGDFLPRLKNIHARV